MDPHLLHPASVDRDRGVVPWSDLGGRPFVERERERVRVAEVLGDACSHDLDVHQPEGDAAAERGVGARAGVGHGEDAGCDRSPVDHELAVTVDDAGHRPHLADRLAVEPVRMAGARPHHSLVHVGVTERTQRLVVRETVERDRPRVVVGRQGQDREASVGREERPRIGGIEPGDR